MGLYFTTLIFDSGVGGLSIYVEIQRILPDLHYIYVFDNAAFPYGERGEAFIVDRVSKILSAIQKRFSLSLAVIACNTVSTISLPFLRKKFSFPIVGVVPAIRLASRLTRNGVIGLLATKRTIRSFYVHKLIECFATNYQVMMLDSMKLVEFAELKLRGEIIDPMDLHRILCPWFRTPMFPDTIVLGCTHFSLLQEELFAILPKDTCLVDANKEVAYRTACVLNRMKLHEKSIKPNSALCTSFTEDTQRLLPTFRRYGFETINQLTL